MTEIVTDNGETFEYEDDGRTSLRLSITPNDDAIEVLIAEYGLGACVGMELSWYGVRQLRSWLDMMLAKHHQSETEETLKSTVRWRPISEAKRDGTEYLLWFPDDILRGRNAGAITGRWFSSPKEIDDGWETIIGSIGEPTHFAEITNPKTDA